MSKITEWIHEEFEQHQKLLQETPEDAHVHVLFLRRLENMQRYIDEHFPNSTHTDEMRLHVHALRSLAGKALEKRL